MKNILYRTQGTCSQFIEMEADENRIITRLSVIGGCNGNLKGIAALVKGKSLEDVAGTLSGITCGGKETSCPDQISKAAAELLKQYDE